MEAPLIALFQTPIPSKVNLKRRKPSSWKSANYTTKRGRSRNAAIRSEPRKLWERLAKLEMNKQLCDGVDKEK
jgi:hypothetical protein